MTPAQNLKVFITLHESESKLTVALSTPYRTSSALQISVAVLPKRGLVDLAKKIAREVYLRSSAIWANEDLEIFFWNFCWLYRQRTALESAESGQWLQAITQSVSKSKPCGHDPHFMDKMCFSELVTAQIGELNQALRLKNNDEIKKLGPDCKRHQERAEWMLKRVRAWLRRQFVLRELKLPNELNDACGRTATQLSQWMAALYGVVVAYESWLSTSATTGAYPGVQLPMKLETKPWTLNNKPYRDLSSLITDVEKRKAVPETGWAKVMRGKLAHKSRTKPREVVAIKSFIWETIGDNVINPRFLRDLKARTSPKHPNILPVYGVYGEVTALGRFPALVSPWCTTVNKYIASRRSQVHAELRVITIVLDLSEQLLSALKYIHGQSKEGCHGNLKATNLLVSQDGRLQLTDFGIGLPQIGTDRHLEQASLAYLSPELTTRISGPTPESDMWAASCAFVEMLTGQVPCHKLQNGEIKLGRAPTNRKPSGVTVNLWNLIWENFRDPKKRLSASFMLTRLWILRYQDNLVGE